MTSWLSARCLFCALLVCASPDDVQVIGFDNIEESAYLQIPLTTMDSRLDWTAPTAVGCILGRIQGDAAEPKLLTTPSSVIVRSSTR